MEIYNKYRIEHVDGTPLKGKRYFVLRLDSDDPVEAAKVDKAMRAYNGELRQCDVGTIDEQYQRYHALGEVYHTLTLANVLEWARKPYKAPVEEKPKKEEPEEPETPPRLDICPKCGKDAAKFIHPTFDGGSYVSCPECHYAPQTETWAPTDAKAAIRWNNLKR